MRNTILSLSYDGTAYHGWQSQTNCITIQDTLQNAILKVTGNSVSVHGCGRTDTGVHAKVYIANFKDPSTIPVERLSSALNHFLPEDICIQKAWTGEEDFDARFSCIKKTYVYRIFNSATPDPFLRNYAYRYNRTLDLAKMQQAAALFVGTHDFAAVRSLGTPVKSTVRTIYNCDIIKKDTNLIEISMCADGFLYNMARSIVGTLLYVSEGKIDHCSISSILDNGDRNSAGPTAPACGLFLSSLVYPQFSL